MIIAFSNKSERAARITIMSSCRLSHVYEWFSDVVLSSPLSLGQNVGSSVDISHTQSKIEREVHTHYTPR